MSETQTMDQITFQKIINKSQAWLHFKSGFKLKGRVNLEFNDPRLASGIWGESAFTTGMSGYLETMTDPSFLGQHIIFTTSHVGNYPSNPVHMQSDRSHATTLIARHFSPNQFLIDQDLVLFHDLDTRALVKHLVDHPDDHLSVLTNSEAPPEISEFSAEKLHCSDLTRVGTKEEKVIIPGENPITLIDYGCKQAIVENLKKMGHPLVLLPSTTTKSEVEKFKPRMIFLSNGPGDPRNYQKEIEQVKEFFTLNVPVRGICLGHQLIGLALGAQIERLPYGQRGINHPVLDRVTGDVIITSQNHGYSIEAQSLAAIKSQNIIDRNIITDHVSLFDQSIEGIRSTDHFLKSVQFHPEAHPGPVDMAPFFDEIESFLNGKTFEIDDSKLENPIDLKNFGRKNVPYKNILLIGSGPIKIGQASEFDYSGTQACKSLREAGVNVVLLNSNPATIMTDPEMAARTYIEPITKENIKKIIENENVDAVLSTMGGQTALNICIELEEEQFLAKNNVALLGANVRTIELTEDRDLFSQELDKLGYQTGKRFRASSRREAIQLASEKVHFPLIIRRDFALGGKGAALVYSDEQLQEILSQTDIEYPLTLEKSLIGYKEIELEVMVDKDKNGVIICSIENVDPCGIHTGDSITVAPAQTISDHCYQNLRKMALHIAKHMGVVAGGANVQFAINPHDENDIVVIEMNPRVSRSSALASKATGYPIAKISALLAIGYTLKEIINDITGASPVAFEPTLDYVALKIPLFPFHKFPTSSHVLGPQMRSVGEVLAHGSSFNEAFLKAARSLELGLEIPSLHQLKGIPFDLNRQYLEQRLKNPRELSLVTVLEAIRKGMGTAEINELSDIDPWFIEQMSLITDAERKIKEEGPAILEDVETLKHYKKMGFTDKFIAHLTDVSQERVYSARVDHHLSPSFKAVDTCSGEFHAETPYFYSTYYEQNEAKSLAGNQRVVAVLGSGPNRIGQGIEFDYSCVKACYKLKERGLASVMINSNPETVSTDYDSSDRLYLSALYSEDIFDILLNEDPEGVITCFSGQTGIHLRQHLQTTFRSNFAQFNFLGSSLETLDLTEDRKKFADVTKKTSLARTISRDVVGKKHLNNAITEIGLPVIIRPSFVIGGESMYIFRSNRDVENLPSQLKEALANNTIVFQVENYLENAIEYDVDLVRDQFGNCSFTVCEHIEHAGVHSGDSGMISPPVELSMELQNEMRDISIQLSEILQVVGPINFQYAVKGNKIYCIEANPRGSRTLPFLSKAFGIDLPGIATCAMLGEKIPERTPTSLGQYNVKQSTFPFDRFINDNILLGPIMRSTGETMGIDKDLNKALFKSFAGNYPNLAKEKHVLVSLSNPTKDSVAPHLKHLIELGFKFSATRGTADLLESLGAEVARVSKVNEDQGTTILNVLKEENIGIVFNTPMSQGHSKTDGELIRNTAIQKGIPCFTRIENIIAVINAIRTCDHQSSIPTCLQDAQKQILN